MTRVPTGQPGTTAAAARGGLVGRAWDSADYLYVVDPARVLLGVVSLPRLLGAPARALLASLMVPAVALSPEADQEEAAILALTRGIKAVPLVDEAGRLRGVVPPRALLEIMHREHTEDLLHLAGVLRHEEVPALPSWRETWSRAQGRLGWLLVGLAGGLLAAGLVAFFEAALRAQLALAFFIPVIVYLADAVGTQTQTLLVRSLALGPASLRQQLAREASIGALLGLALGALTFLWVLASWADARLAAIIGLSLAASCALATLVATLVPWGLYRLRRDPAVGSGPAATILQDLLSLAVYFLIATALLRWW